MTVDLKKFEDSLDPEFSFGFTPKWGDVIYPYLNREQILPIVLKTFNILNWLTISSKEDNAIAIRPGSWIKNSYEITVSFESGKISIVSKSQGLAMLDFGINHKNVELFKYTFLKTAEKSAEKSDEKELSK